MSTLQVHILAGPQTGARLQLNQPPVTFGRSRENTLVLDMPVVSRQHGELTLDEQGRWVAINHSSNTLRVGKKKVTKKPVPLVDNAVITIGDTEVFRVHLAEPEPETQPQPADANANTDPLNPYPQQAATPPGTGMKGRSKLWIGIGVWLAFLLGVSLFLATSDSGNNNSPTSGAIYVPGSEINDMEGPEAGQAAIKRLLLEPLAPKDPNETRYTQHIQNARDAAVGGTRSLYDAYRHYQVAVSYAEDRDAPMQSLDKIRYDGVVQQLAEIIYAQYMQAYRLYNSGNYKAARNILDDLRRDFYNNPDPDDELANHIKRLRSYAHRKAG